MNTLKNRIIEQYAFFTWALMLLLFIIIAILVVEAAENKRFIENQRNLTIEQLSTIRTKLESVLNSELLLARSIIIEVETNTDITKERFFKIAQHFMKASNHIKNIGLAKGTILTYVYPIKGNEKAIGLDYKKLSSQWPAVQRVIQGRKTVVAGPLNLVQGGVGIIGRTPIFVYDGNSDLTSGEYFGILSVVINMPSMMEAAGLNNEDSALQISIRGKDGLGAEGAIFFGPKDIFKKNPIFTDVTLPGKGSWQMAAIPANGWIKQSSNILFYRLLAMVVGLIILFFLFIQQREMNHRKKIEEERMELIKQLRNALSEVKTLSGLIPICSSCKKIRDDQGYWNNLEAYIEKHSDALFSHSLCVECSEKLYGNEDWYKEIKKQKK